MDYLKSLEDSLIYKDDSINICPDDKFITLSTCSYETSNARMLLIGVKR